MCMHRKQHFYTITNSIPAHHPLGPPTYYTHYILRVLTNAERQFKQPGSINLNIGGGRLCWTADPHMIVSCFHDNYVRLWVSDFG